MSDAEIQGGVWLRVFELLLKHIFDPTLGQQLYDILALTVELAQQQTGMEMLVTMLRYIARAGAGASKDEIHETVTQLFAKDGGALVSYQRLKPVGLSLAQECLKQQPLLLPRH